MTFLPQAAQVVAEFLCTSATTAGLSIGRKYDELREQREL